MTTKRYKAVKLYVDEAEYDQAMEILRSQGNTASRWFRGEIKQLLLRFSKFSGGK